MNFLLVNFIIALATACLTSLILGIVVLRKGQKDIARPFSLFSFGICWWSFFQILVLTSTDKLSALTWMRIEKIGVFFVPAFFLCFTIRFLKIRNREWLLGLAYLLSLIFAAFCPT